MKKTLYIHIGAHKTGTSALQFFLTANRELLKSRGYLYPGKFPEHHDVVKEIVRSTPESIQHGPAIRNCLKEIEESGAGNVILSSEEFEGLGEKVTLLKSMLEDRFLVKIIFYVRRQDHRIESMYNQRVRQEGVWLDNPFPDFVGNGYIGSIDYAKILRPWSETFGNEHIIVRCYEEEQLPQGIFYDFLSAVGLSTAGQYLMPEKRINASLNGDLIEVIRICNSRYRDDPAFQSSLVKRLTVINQDCHGGTQRLLSPLRRREIIRMYEESNAQVAREYLGRPDGRLFFAPLPDRDESWEPYKGLTLEKTVPVLAQMLMDLEKEDREAMKCPVISLRHAARYLKQCILHTLKSVR